MKILAFEGKFSVPVSYKKFYQQERYLYFVNNIDIEYKIGLAHMHNFGAGSF